MSFKLIITQTKKDGTENKIHVENSQPFKDQKGLLDFLRPLVQEEQGTTEIVLGARELDMPEQTDAPEAVEEPKEVAAEEPKEEAKKEMSVVEQKQPVINRTKQEPADKVEVKKVSDRETGVAQIHCPSCGLQTAKHVGVKSKYIPCPTCKTKLFLYALHSVRGEPDKFGVSFKANNVYLDVQERWEFKHGK